MASYHCTVNTGKPGQGQKHAAYICREGSYAKKKGDLEYIEHGNMPQWAEEHPLGFWKAADDYERVNGRPYREIEIALPNELDPAQRRELVQAFIKEHIGANHPYSLAIHCPRATLKKDTEQPHAHIMFSERKLDGIEREAELFFKRANNAKPELGGTKKERDWQKRERLTQLRESWAEHQNRALEKYGHAVRVDHRNLEAQREEALQKGDYRKAAELDRPAEQHLGPKVAQRTARMAKEHLETAKNPADLEQKRAEYYDRVEPSNRAQNVYQIRDYKRTATALEREKAQLRQLSPEYRLAEIKQELQELGQKRREVAGKVVTEERAALIARAVFSKGEYQRLTQEAALLKKERQQMEKAELRHRGIKPGLLEREAVKAHAAERIKLEQWHKKLADRESIHQKKVGRLQQKMSTPEAQVKIARIKKGVLQKNQPQRELLNHMNSRINELRRERAVLVEHRIKQVEHSEINDLQPEMVIRNDGKERGQTGRQIQHTANGLQRAVNQLSQEDRRRYGLKARVFRKESDEPEKGRGLER